jgi:hypothetical protein
MVHGGLFKSLCNEYECPDGTECLGVGPEGPAVIAVEDPPGFDVDVCGFDRPADFVEARVALVVAFRELSSDGCLGRTDRSGALVAPIRDDLVDVDLPGDVVLVPSGLVVATAGEGVGDPRHLAVGVGRNLVSLAVVWCLAEYSSGWSR